MNRHGLLERIKRFALVGGIGFTVDAGLTEALYAAGVGPLVARALAVVVAVATTFLLNRHLTFRSTARGLAVAAEFGRYAATSSLSTAINYAIYAALMTSLPGLRPVLAVAAGVAVGMVVNFLAYDRFVFRRPE